MSLFRRINEQFNAVGPWGRLLLVAYYVAAFTLIFIVATTVASSFREWGKPFDRWVASWMT